MIKDGFLEWTRMMKKKRNKQDSGNSNWKIDTDITGRYETHDLDNKKKNRKECISSSTFSLKGRDSYTVLRFKARVLHLRLSAHNFPHRYGL